VVIIIIINDIFLLVDESSWLMNRHGWWNDSW